MTDLIIEYEAMSQEGTVVFLEKKEFLSLIEHYQRKYLIDRALEVVEHALTQHSFTVDFYVRKAQLLIEHGCSEEALEVISKANVFDPSASTMTLPLRIRALISLGLNEEANEELNEFRMLLNDDFSMATACYFEALILEQYGEYRAMFDALKQALYIVPGHVEALSYLGIAVEITGQYEECVAICKMVIDDNPYNAMAWYYLANAYAGLERFEKAISCYEYSFLSDSNFELAYRDYISLSVQLKKYQKSIDACDEYLAQFGKDEFILTQMGIAFIHTDRIKEGRKLLNATLKVDEEHEDALYHLGLSFILEDKPEKAISYFERVCEVNDLQDEYLAALAEAYNKAGLIDEAIECYREVTETAPEMWQYWVQYATLLMELGDEEAAIEVLEEAELNAYCPELSIVKISCLITMGYRKEALRVLAEMMEEYYEIHEMLFELLPCTKEDNEILSLIAAYKPYP